MLFNCPKRDCARIFIPYFVVRRIHKMLPSLDIMAADFHKRCEPVLWRLSDIPSLSIRQRLQRSVLHWLLSEPDNEFDTIECEIPSETYSQFVDRVAQGIPPEKREQFLKDFQKHQDARAKSKLEFQKFPDDLKDQRDQEVHSHESAFQPNSDQDLSCNPSSIASSLTVNEGKENA